MAVSTFALAAAATFNLVCTGTTDIQAVGMKSSKEFNYEYRFDLDKKVYCDGECKVTRQIPELLPTAIILDNIDKDDLSERLMIKTTIDRETGAYTNLSTSRDNRLGDRSILIMKSKGQCVKGAFTGFPSPTVKF